MRERGRPVGAARCTSATGATAPDNTAFTEQVTAFVLAAALMSSDDVANPHVRDIKLVASDEARMLTMLLPTRSVASTPSG